MKKTALSLVAVVGLVGLFSLFNFFINSPSGQYAYSGYSRFDLDQCLLLEPDKSLGFDECIKKGFDVCGSMYFAEPGDMTGWDYCYDTCRRNVARKCV